MPYRILSLDGGGTWALIQVKALMRIYGPTTTGHAVLKDFDLLAANSGGSIVAAALMCNFPLQTILSDFLNPSWRDKIFVPLPWYSNLNPASWVRMIGIPYPKYQAAGKLAGLQNALKTPTTDFGGTALDRLPALWGGKPDVVITTFDYDRERALVFRSNIKSSTASPAGLLNVTLAEAVHASSNAPIKYFDQPAIVGGHRFWDGAMAGLNNPLLVAINEAIGALGAESKNEIRVRSIGTASVFLPISGRPSAFLQSKDNPGLLDIGKAANCILDDPPDEATFEAYAYLDGQFSQQFPITSDKVVRLNPLIQPVLDSNGNWEVPGANLPQPPFTMDEFNELVTMGIDPDQRQVTLIDRYCDAWIDDLVPNQPIRANPTTLACEIGQAKFSDGQKLWQ